MIDEIFSFLKLKFIIFVITGSSSSDSESESENKEEKPETFVSSVNEDEAAKDDQQMEDDYCKLKDDNVSDAENVVPLPDNLPEDLLQVIIYNH